MLPTTNTPKPSPSEVERDDLEARAAVTAEYVEGTREPPGNRLRPIGPERLRALREAIENGTYPSEEDVVGGLQRLFRWDE